MSRALWQRFREAFDQLDDSPLGDAIGCVCLSLTGYVLFVIAGCLQ
ncbi:hypothetical protein [Paracoccus denitrificans]